MKKYRWKALMCFALALLLLAACAGGGTTGGTAGQTTAAAGAAPTTAAATVAAAAGTTATAATEAVTAAATEAVSGTEPISVPIEMANPDELTLTEDGVTPRGVLPMTIEPVTLKMAIPTYPTVEDYATNRTTRLIKQLMNIDLEFVLLPSTPADLSTKINLMFASNDLPDCFTLEYPGFEMASSTLWEFAQAGQIAPIEPYIEKYGVGYDLAMEWLGPEKAQFVTDYLQFPDGHTYSYAYMNNVDIDIYPLLTWVYMPWLEEAGLEEPKTLDDFYNMAMAFKQRGSGIIPISAAKEHANRFIAYIGNAFQYSDFTWRLKVDAGKVAFTANNAEYKQTLEYLNKLYTDSLLDPLMFTQSPAEIKARLAQPELTIGIINYQSPSQYMDSAQEPMLDFHIIDALEGPNGFKSTMSRGMQINHTFIVTNQCENPALAVRMADFFLTEDQRHLGGEQGVDWDWADEDGTDIAGNPAYYKQIRSTGSATSQNLGW